MDNISEEYLIVLIDSNDNLLITFGIDEHWDCNAAHDQKNILDNLSDSRAFFGVIKKDEYIKNYPNGFGIKYLKKKIDGTFDRLHHLVGREVKLYYSKDRWIRGMLRFEYGAFSLVGVNMSSFFLEDVFVHDNIIEFGEE